MEDEIPLDGATEPITVSVGIADLEVSPTSAVPIEDGRRLEMKIKGLDVTFKDSIYYEADKPISWNKDEVEKAIRSSWMSGEDEWPDTSDPSWEDNRIVKRDTLEYAVLRTVVSRQTCWTHNLDDEIGEYLNVGNVVYRLKKKNLVSGIDRVKDGSLIVPTHLGYKEMLCLEGPDFLAEFDVEKYLEEMPDPEDKE